MRAIDTIQTRVTEMKIEMVPATLSDLHACPRALERGLALGFEHDVAGRLAVRDVLATVEQASRPKPWNSYWALSRPKEAYVGIGAFKTAPDPRGAIEIAYYTFPRLQGRGVATQVVRRLTSIAAAFGLTEVIALTLPESNASTSVLTRAGFRMVRMTEDPEDGMVWAWSLDLKGTPHEL